MTGGESGIDNLNKIEIKNTKGYKNDKGPESFKDAIDLITLIGKIKAVEGKIKPEDLKYDKFEDSDFDPEKQRKTKDALEEIKSGVQRPVVVWLGVEKEKTNLEVLKGNHHLWAYKQLGYKEVPIVISEEDYKLATKEKEG